MAQLEPLLPAIVQAGASLVFIAAQKRAGIFKPERFLSEHPTPFPFLLDEDRSATKAYGVYHALGKDAFRIARPATFLLGRDAVIRFLYVGADQKDRAPLEPLLEAVRKTRG
jgi:peroxiredoxin